MTATGAGRARALPWIGAWLAEAERVDRAVYGAVGLARTPGLDELARAISRAADHSRISIGAGVAMSVVGGPRVRRAAIDGLVAVAATSAAVNLVLKPLARRARPVPEAAAPPRTATVRMPGSRSFPSGHAASAVAFASGVGRELPSAAAPAHALAALVGYSRVHTGVHYPSDVIAGAVLGAAIADLVGRELERRRAGRSSVCA